VKYIVSLDYPAPSPRATQLKRDFPQLRSCIVGNTLDACGAAIPPCVGNPPAQVFTIEKEPSRLLLKDGYLSP